MYPNPNNGGYPNQAQNVMAENLLFQNQSKATIADIYSALNTVMSQMDIPNTAETVNMVLGIIQPQLMEHLSRNNQAVADMSKLIEMLINKNRSQIMQNEKLRKIKKTPVRIFGKDADGCGSCMETGKELIKVGYIDVLTVSNVNIEKDGAYQEYKFVDYLDSKSESRKAMIPLNKLSAKSLIALFKGFEYICSSKQIVNEYLAYCINGFSKPETITIPEYSGFSFLTVNGTEKASFCCNNGEMDMELLEKCSHTFKSKIMPDGNLRADEISTYVNAYLNTPEKIVLFAYCICGLLSSVLYEIGSPMTQILMISSPNQESTRQACCYLQTYNKGKDAVSFSTNITAVRKAIHAAKDETAVIVDNTRADDEKKRSSVMQELLVLNSDEESKPHNTAIISDNAQRLISIEQKICMPLSDDFCNHMNYEEEKNMRRALSLMMRYVIDIICQDYEGFKTSLRNQIDFTIQNGKAEKLAFIQSRNSYCVIVAVICIISKYLNIPIEELETADFLFNMFLESAETEGDSSDAIADEFGKILNAKIKSDEIKITLHSKEMDFISGEPQVIVKDDLALLEESTITNVILPDMKTTESVYRLTEALSESDLLHTVKKNRYPCTVYHTGESLRVTFIAVKLLEMLNQNVQLKIQAKDCEEWFGEGNSDPNMMPIVVNQMGYEACCKYDFEEKANLHCFITGQSGSGKTHYMTEFVFTLQKAGQLVVVLDTSDSFTKEAIINNLSAGGNETVKKEVKEYVEENVVFWKVEKDGVPVNILNMSNSVPFAEKAVLRNIVSANNPNMGKKQRAELSRCIDNMLKSNSVSMMDLYEEIMEGEVSDSLSMQFEDVLSVFLEYKQSEKSWGEFLKDKNGMIVISSAALSGSGGSALVDMLLMSLFYYQRNNPDRHIAVVIDEVQNQNCGKGSAIEQVLKEGRKYHMSLIYATQYLSETNRERMKTMNNAGMKVYLHPDSTSAKSISTAIQEPFSKLNSMKQGECYVVGTLYNNKEHANRPGKVHGFTYRNFVKPETE